MALSRIKVWSLNETLTSSDLNAEFNNILDNALSLISPLTANLAFGNFRATGLNAGSVSNPSIQPTTDTNTGFYFSAADTVDVTAGGVRTASFATATTGVNYHLFTPAAAGSAITWTAAGSDSNIDIVTGTKGTGTYFLSTNSTNRWEVAGSSGHLLAVADATYDIGASGATRPRNMYLSGSAFISTILNLNNTLQTGATAGDAVAINTGGYRFSNAAVTSAANYGVVSDANNNLAFHVPGATDSINFNFGGTLVGWVVSENAGMGIVFSGESSADHSAPAANSCVLYIKDTGGGKTRLVARFASGAVQTISTEP